MKKIIQLLCLIPHILISCDKGWYYDGPDVIVDPCWAFYGASDTYPFIFFAENKTASELKITVIPGTVTKLTASYDDFTPAPDDLLTLKTPVPNNEGNDSGWQNRKIAPNKLGMVSMTMQTEPAASCFRPKEYFERIKDKRITFILEITDSTQKTVRIAGWDLPQDEWQKDDVIGSQWGLFDMTDRELPPGFGIKVPHLYTRFEGEPYNIPSYPYNDTIAYYLSIGGLDESSVSILKVTNKFSYSIMEESMKDVWPDATDRFE